jgi:hypothetical protein
LINGLQKLVVTGRGLIPLDGQGQLKKAIPVAQIQRTGFPWVFILEREGEAIELAQEVIQKCSENIGHVTAVLAVASDAADPLIRGGWRRNATIYSVSLARTVSSANSLDPSCKEAF